MPELPEVETVRRKFERALQGQTITTAEVVQDDIVWSHFSVDEAKQRLVGNQVVGTGRRGKYFWLNLKDGDTLYGHLGMAGWVRILGEPTTRLLEHGNAPLDDENGRPRFLKLLLEGQSGMRVAMTDGRRLARLWFGAAPESEPKIQELGPDMWLNPWNAQDLCEKLSKRKAPMKSLLLDQTLFAGVGNWIADEVLWRSQISPLRLGSAMKIGDCEKLLSEIKSVLDFSIHVGADMHAYPADWLFHARWGGDKGPKMHECLRLERKSVGGRTTVWSPDRQK